MTTRALHGITAHRVLHVALWVATAVLCLTFAITASIKIVFPLHDVQRLLPWTVSMTPFMVRGLGIIELIGVQGLLLPGWTRTMPRLVPLAASGLASLMVAAGAFHLARNEPGQIGLPVVLFTLALFVAWGRATAVPIRPLRD